LIKRTFDIIASFLGLVILSPVLIVIALLIKLLDPGPVIFRQRRTGRNGKLFAIFKFRTMTPVHHGGTVSVKGESRITPIGAVLRKHKLDELPELWNVLIGDMSFVGPRPDLPELTEKLSGNDKLILGLRPGITGPASLKYANEEELLSEVEDPRRYNEEVLWPDKVKMNLDYYYNHSFFGDISLIIKTVFRVKD
jgi:lipopolysaccharide/colanic/teichoic acid biosynthesis glycosyltransferase